MLVIVDIGVLIVGLIVLMVMVVVAVVVVAIVLAIVFWPVVVAGFMAVVGVVATGVTLGLGRIRRRRHPKIIPPPATLCEADPRAHLLDPDVPDQGLLPAEPRPRPR